MQTSDSRKRAAERAGEQTGIECTDSRCHDWRCESCKHPTREQVVADAEAAWEKWADDRAEGGRLGTVYLRHRDGTPFHSGFVAGFLSGRGFDEAVKEDSDV